MSFKYGDQVLITKDEKHNGFYEGLKAYVVAAIDKESKDLDLSKIGQEKIETLNYSLVLPKLLEDKNVRYLEVTADQIQKV